MCTLEQWNPSSDMKSGESGDVWHHDDEIPPVIPPVNAKYRLGLPRSVLVCYPYLILHLKKACQKSLDKAGEIGYIIGALRRQQVGFPVNPAEDNNDPNMSVFVPFCLFCRKVFFLSVSSRC